ncbi:MAG: phosphate acyltransferase [Alphaproteobacteria bacterium]|nr:phosphate acyltransferase [Alphaproteobacteria bacterium]
MKTLLIVGAQKNYIKMWQLYLAGVFNIKKIVDMPLGEFQKLEFDMCDTIICKGTVESDDFLRVILQLNKKLGGGHLSHAAVFKKRCAKPFIMSDAGLNIAPDLEGKKHILQNAISLARKLKLGWKVINFITPSSKINPKIKSSTDAEILEKFVAENYPGATAYHNAFDVCFSKKSQEEKKIFMPYPNILVCDDIDQGNSTWKAMTIFGRVSVAAFVVGNPLMPHVILNSRSDSKSDKIWSVKIAAI